MARIFTSVFEKEHVLFVHESLNRRKKNQQTIGHRQKDDEGRQ